MFNDTSSLRSFLATRRSAKPKEMAGPKPDLQTLTKICELALRTPDHGKLAPWRFLIIPDEAKEKLRALLISAFRAANPNASEGQAQKAAMMPDFDAALVVAIYAPVVGAKIPLWEQELSAGAACMNLLHAAHAYGFHPGWVTPWPTFDGNVHTGLGCSEEEKIAGFVFIGTPGNPLTERERPDPAAKISLWQG